MQEKIKKHILRLVALVLTLLYVVPVGYFLGLRIGAIAAAAIFLLLILLITKKSYQVALTVILFYAGLTIINLFFYAWVMHDFFASPY